MGKVILKAERTMKGLDRLSQNARQVLKSSIEIAQDLSQKTVEIEHLFVALCKKKPYLSTQILSSFGVDFGPVIKSILAPNKKNTISKKDANLSIELKTVIQRAYVISKKMSHVYVGTEHLLIAIFTLKNNPLVKKLAQLGLNEISVRERTLSIASYPPGIFVYIGRDPENDSSNSILKFLGRDLTELAHKGRLMPLIGREKEIDKIIQILSRKTKNNPIIVGDSGVGKTALVEGLAQRIASDRVPSSLLGKRIIAIDTASIVAGSKVRGELEEKVLDIINEVKASKDTILFIDEIHTILGAGAASGSSMDIADILKPVLTSGEIRCIGATTVSLFQNVFEEDVTLARRFQLLDLDELSIEETVILLKQIKKIFEEYHGIKIDNTALEAAARLSDRYIFERFLPDKAIDLIDEACARERLKIEKKYPNSQKSKRKLYRILKQKEAALNQQNYEGALELRNLESKVRNELKLLEKKTKEINMKSRKVVTEETVREIISEKTGIPLTTLSKSDIDAVRNIAKKLKKHIIGQKDAIESVEKALKRSRIGISDTARPLASFLFLGPTGVGKTELSKVIAREFFGAEKNLIQIDMSEMMEPHSVSKMIGSPPGYVGYQEGGQLTDRIRRSPYSVVLFDEIEKAHPDVLNILLQIFEEGQLTDSKGRSASFRNAIIILTSNIGAERISNDKNLGFEVGLDYKRDEEIEEAYEEMKEVLMEELKEELKPEFLNRLDDIVIFRSLNRDDAIKIVKLLVQDLNKRLIEKGFELDLSDAALKYITEKGFDKNYGARPLRRYLQDEVESLVVDYVLESRIQNKENLKKISIGTSKKRLVISKK